MESKLVRKNRIYTKFNDTYWKEIIKIAFPMIIQSLVFQLQSLTDKAFLGNIDTLYISAIGAAQFPFNTTLDSLVALSTGLIIIIAQMAGAQDTRRINHYVKSAVFYNSLLSCLLFMMWFIFPRQVLGVLNVDQEILPYSVQYVRMCSWYFLVLGVDVSMQAMLQGMGNTKPIMYAGVAKVGINIILSWVLIFGHFGFPRMNILGAAVGTLIANIISAVMLTGYCMVIKRKEYGLHKENSLWFKLHPYKKIIQLGLPTGMEYLMWNASNLVLIRVLNGISYMAMAVYTLTFGIEVVIYAVFSSMAKSTMTLMGQSIGAKDQMKANRYYRECLIMDLIVVAGAIVLFTLLNQPILGIFSKDTKVINEAAPYLIVTGFIMIPKSLNVVIGNSIRAYGDTKWMLYTQMIGSVFVIGCGYLLTYIMHLGITAIFMTLFLDEALRATLNYFHFNKHYKRIKG